MGTMGLYDATCSCVKGRLELVQGIDVPHGSEDVGDVEDVAGRSEAKIALLRKELESKIMNEEDDMDTFLAGVKDINEQLISAGEVISDNSLVQTVLDALPDSYHTFASTSRLINQRNPEVGKFDEVCTLLLQEALSSIAAQRKEAVEDSPFLERLKKNEYEGFFLVDAIDEYAVAQLKEYDGKKLVFATKEGLKLDESENEKQKKEEKKEPKAELDIEKPVADVQVDHEEVKVAGEESTQEEQKVTDLEESGGAQSEIQIETKEVPNNNWEMQAKESQEEKEKVEGEEQNPDEEVGSEEEPRKEGILTDYPDDQEEMESTHPDLQDRKSIHEWDALNADHANEVAAFRMQNAANECQIQELMEQVQ
ncbi:hypothetical protein L7F22_020439 [Adiantum nelumboides]|nr:hypothetical protein [Adiantum nelumboides]